MPHLRKSCRSSRGSTKSSGPNTVLEATGHSVRFLAGVGLYPVARASAWAFGFQKYLAFSHGSRTINPERGALCHVNGLLQ